MDPDQEKVAKLFDEQAAHYSTVVLTAPDKEPQIAALVAVYIFTGLAEIVRKIGSE